MTREERLRLMVLALPPERREESVALLRTIVHDLNGLLSVIRMESFVLDRLQTDPAGAATAQGDHGIGSSARNLQAASERAVQYVKALETAVREIA